MEYNYRRFMKEEYEDFGIVPPVFEDWGKRDNLTAQDFIDNINADTAKLREYRLEIEQQLFYRNLLLNLNCETSH